VRVRNLVERRNWTGILAVLSSTCVALVVGSCELPEDDAAQPEEQQAATRVGAPIAPPRIRAERRACVPRHTTSFSVCRRRHVPARGASAEQGVYPGEGFIRQGSFHERLPRVSAHLSSDGGGVHALGLECPVATNAKISDGRTSPQPRLQQRDADCNTGTWSHRVEQRHTNARGRCGGANATT
jgi:hypothetical protein